MLLTAYQKCCNKADPQQQSHLLKIRKTRKENTGCCYFVLNHENEFNLITQVKHVFHSYVIMLQ